MSIGRDRLTKLLEESVSSSYIINHTSSNLNNSLEMTINTIKSENRTVLPECPIEKENFLSKMRDYADISQAVAIIQNLYLRKIETKITFNTYLFIKYFLYHFIYFFLFGPLLGFLLIPFEGYYFVRNLGFFGISRLCFLYFFIFLAFITNIIIIIYEELVFNKEFSIEANSGIFFIFILMLNNCLITGIRNGFLSSKETIEFYKKYPEDI
jgi:hypothetical protein